jgi:hypothetical protein
MPDKTRELDDAYTDMFNAVQKFFRFHKSNPVNRNLFNDEYYARAGEVLKSRIDFEVKHINSDYVL